MVDEIGVHVGIVFDCALTLSSTLVAQELGGKSPNIILDDDNFAAAVACGIAGIMNNSGQSCNAPTRMLSVWPATGWTKPRRSPRR